MKFVMLRKSETPTMWAHVGAVEVPDLEDGDGRVLEQEAVEKLGMPGVFVAIPFADWVIFEAVGQFVVTPVLRMEQPAARAQRDGEEEPMDVGDDPDMAGMRQGPRGGV